jgi:hypothetical protein
VRSRSGAFAFLVALALTLTLTARLADAHEPFEITTDARALRSLLSLRITMAGRTAALACPDVIEKARPLTPEDLGRHRQPLKACASKLYVVTLGGARVEPMGADVSLSREGDFDAIVHYALPRAGTLTLDAAYLARLGDAMYGATLTVTSERHFLGQALLRASSPRLSVRIPEFGEVPGESAPHVPTFGDYLRLGLEHILTGYDHLAFLFGLLAVCRKLTSVLALVTAFTLAHSLTLALAALGLVTLPSSLVEPLIAVSIVAVAADNLYRGDTARHRWALAFAFGLIHGFGFAGVLASLGLGQSGAPIALPLFGFNLGVELGQVGVAVLVLPLLFRLRRVPAFERHGARAISMLVGLAGVYWLVARVVG